MKANSLKKIAIVVTHPIQYYVPVFQHLAKYCDLKVFYTWGESSLDPIYDPDFKKTIKWDIPLLEGYTFEFLKNNAKSPGSHHFNGIKNPDIIEKIKDFNPHAVLIYGWSYYSHLKVIMKLHGKYPIWFRGDSNLLDKTSKWKSLLKGLFLKFIYKRIDIAFYVGTNNKSYYKYYGLPEYKLIFAPHAIDNNRFAENRTLEAKALREKLNIPTEAVLFLYAGKFESKKDPIILMKSFLQLKTKNAHLLFVGNGALEADLMKLGKKAVNIHFHPFANQSIIPVFYQMSDIFCLPSQGPQETWGLAVNEAMASGKAVIVSNKVGCAIDLVKEGYNGFIFEAGNAEDLLDKMHNLLNLEKIKAFGNNASQTIKAWNFEKQSEAILNKLYESY